jgi:ssDNA-binding Zn-finger/Zn-ribbon topoisomerase 1
MKLICDSKMVDEPDKDADAESDTPVNEELKADENEKIAEQDKPEAEDKGILGKIPFIKGRSQRDVVGGDVLPTLKKKPKYDKNGRCLKHPSIIIARKKPFGKGWEMTKSGCPHCSSMNASDQELNGSSNNVAADYCISVDELLAPSGKKFDWTTGNEKRIAGVDDFLATSKALRASTSLSEAASLARSNFTNPSSTSKCISNRGSQQPDESARSSGLAIVSKMPYKTLWKQEGWYSGEVNEFGVPHGCGRMRMKNGDQHTGQWLNGYSEQYLENQNKMKRGFGSNRSAWKENNGMILHIPQEPPGHSARARSIRPRC